MAWNNGGNGGGNGKAKYEHKRNRGSVFDNDHKTTDKHPDFTGSANIEGTIYWVSGWTQMTKSGKRQMSLSFTRQDERPQQPTPQQNQTKPARGGW